MNLRIRQFKEQLIALFDSFSDVPLEARILCLTLVTNKATELSNEAIIEELGQEVENAEGLPKD